MPESRQPLLAGNWKMHMTRAEARALAEAIRSAAGTRKDREVAVAPPFTALDTVAQALAGSPVHLAAQDVHWEARGAFTGEISPEMLADAGCRYVIVGHSERRQYFGETDAAVQRKVAALLRGGLTPILCVGETLAEREANETLAVIARQLRAALSGLTEDVIERMVIAYEPVWAIGTGRTASPAQAQETHRAVREILAERSRPGGAGRVRILYGGSVKPDNIDGLMAEPDIDGALVGGASLDASAFARIIDFRRPGAGA